MTSTTLADVLQPALAGNYAVAGLVCLGWEDARAYVRAAEAEALPVILQAGPTCRVHTPLSVLGAMFRTLADEARVPVVIHLDHAHTLDECRSAIDAGFTSIMYDGSGKPLQQNIDDTAAAAMLAHAAGVSCEGEIGFVGSPAAESRATDPAEAARFAADTAIDAMAISVGNLHLHQRPEGPLDETRIRAIEATADVPLVIHGGSGVPVTQRRHLARTSSICKFNVGTELRLAFGTALRTVLAREPDMFDRVAILAAIESPLEAAARAVLRTLAPEGRVAA